MPRVPIQLPNDVFAKAMKVCEAREISLSELTRRGIEHMLHEYAGEWQPPKPRNLGWQGLSDEELKEQSQMTNSELIHSAQR